MDTEHQCGTAEECWRRIEAFPDYAVSCGGCVKRITDGQPNCTGQPTVRAGYIKSQGYSGQGRYPSVSLTRDGEEVTKYVHDLVAEAYIGPKPLGYQVDHINRDREDNAPSNLQYLPESKNTAQGALRGEAAPWSKLKYEDVSEIRRRYREKDVSQYDLAKKYGVDRGTIAKIVRGERWTHVK